ncbi:MAG: DUF1499 domain-containing protein [Gammaproteobacteria bacterium]|nr:DUF1499 domain-containing protein [Gammaproteobacteria bacterium]
MSLTVLVVLAALLLARRYLDLPVYPVFKAYLAVSLVGLLVGLAGMIAAAVGAFQGDGAKVMHGLSALLMMSVPLLLTLVAVGPQRFGGPMIHDVSTDMADPPEFVAAREQRTSGDNPTAWAGPELAAEVQSHYPDLAPVMVQADPRTVLEQVIKLAEVFGWEVMRIDKERFEVEAVDKTWLWGFKDDVIVRVTPGETGSRVDVRSASRVGKGDLGANAARVRRFAAALQANTAHED